MTTNRKSIWAWAAVLSLATIAAYSNTFSVPFLYDDAGSIVSNPTIRRLSSIWEVLSPPRTGGLTVSGRPVLNLSLALNHAISGEGTWSYHALNLAIHIAAGLVLFGIVRRMLSLPGLAPRHAGAALPAAAAVAGMWMLHPLQTESVTYIVQRSESLMGLFFLLTLYGFLRGATAQAAGEGAPGVAPGFGWYALSVFSCALGMATKEVMATAPMMVFLFDRTFLAGTFKEAWAWRGRLHAALACTWLLLVSLVASTGGNRGGTIGFGSGVGWWAHLLTQPRAIARYLKLSFWPHPLAFDYGAEWVRSAADVLPYAVPVIALGLLSLVALKRSPVLGFSGFWFFAILAPTSLMPGAIQMTVEHRMYLPLAAVMTLLALAMVRAVGRPGLAACMGLALVFGGVTFARNRDYRSVLSIWEDTVAKRPDNVLARYNYAFVLLEADRVPEALVQYERAVQLAPNEVDVRNNYGVALTKAGRYEDAIAQFGEASQRDPLFADVYYNRGLALRYLGRSGEAASAFREAIRLRPDFIEARNTLGLALTDTGRVEEAVAVFEEGLRRRPGDADLVNNLGVALIKLERFADAIALYEKALSSGPGTAELLGNLGIALAKAGRLTDAAARFEDAIRMKPDDADLHLKRATILGMLGQDIDAANEKEIAARLQSAAGRRVRKIDP